MSFGKDISIEGSMSEAVEGGANLAWRLLATLEGSSFLLATSALLAYTVRNKITRRNRANRSIRTVLVTNTNNLLGRELKRRIEEHGCVVIDATSVATSGADSVARSGEHSVAASGPSVVDALIVVGAEPKEGGLNGVAGLVTEDVYDNLKLLELLSGRVRRGGCMAWACASAGASAGASGTDTFSGTSAAFDSVLQASLQHIAQICYCEPIWVGRCEGSEQTAEHIVAALMSFTNNQNASRFSVRNAVNKVGLCVCRCLKIVT